MVKMLDIIHPGEILLEEFMKPFAMSQNRLAREIDVPPNRIHEIIKGKRGITADTALRLHKFFNTTPEFWINLQTHYDLTIARRDHWESIQKRVRTIDINEMQPQES